MVDPDPDRLSVYESIDLISIINDMHDANYELELMDFWKNALQRKQQQSSDQELFSMNVVFNALIEFLSISRRLL